MECFEKKPLALYLHIPFCVQKCLYCDFLSQRAAAQEKEQYVTKLLEEWQYWKPLLQKEYQITSIFIGGGTPTCLNPKQLSRIGEGIFQKHPLEFTIEANPGTLTKEHIDVLKEMGVNRVSMGLQSAQDRELKALGRIHSYHDFLKSYALLRENGFDNLNIDLMADIPCQTLESYRDTLSKVLALEPEHISSYSLMVEEGTPFYQMQQEGKLFLPDEDTDRQMYALTQEMLVTKGYERYEISNYAKEGKACLHNQTYWKMGEYLGIGLGAASYFQGCRFSNVADYAEYISFPVKELSGKHIPLTKKEEMEEYVFLGLRMMQGISTTEYRKRFDVDFYQQYETVLPELFEKCLLAEDANHGRIYLTNQGIDVSNRVLAEFLLD